jgi:hypothetical protein
MRRRSGPASSQARGRMEMRWQNGAQRDSAGLSGTGFPGLGALTWALGIHGRGADGMRVSRGGEWRDSRSAAILMGRNGRSVKPSVQPTQVRTLHLPRKTPGQTRCRCMRLPGLLRVRERSGRPLAVAVGQPWARSGQVSGLQGRGRGARPACGQLRHSGWMRSYLCRSEAISRVPTCQRTSNGRPRFLCRRIA